WWVTDRRVEGAAGTVHLRRGPVVYCVEGVDHPDLDLRDLAVDPTAAPDRAFYQLPSSHGGLHHRVEPETEPRRPASIAPVPYCEWANRGPTTMRIRFPTT